MKNYEIILTDTEIDLIDTILFCKLSKFKKIVAKWNITENNPDMDDSEKTILEDIKTIEKIRDKFQNNKKEINLSDFFGCKGGLCK